MEASRRRALSEFYREEFCRHLSHLEACGLAHGESAEVIRRCRRLVGEIDHICCREGFPVVAESILQSFETLSRLSEVDQRTAH